MQGQNKKRPASLPQSVRSRIIQDYLSGLKTSTMLSESMVLPGIPLTRWFAVIDKEIAVLLQILFLYRLCHVKNQHQKTYQLFKRKTKP